MKKRLKNPPPIDPSSSDYVVEYQPQLMEETVLLAVAGNPQEAAFRTERDEIYSFDPVAREAAFQTLHQKWFEIFGLHRPLQQVLADWPVLKAQTQRCLVVKAPTKKETFADLYVSGKRGETVQRGDRSILIQVLPEHFMHIESLLTFLRYELLHVVDMLDTDFGYEPALPRSETGALYDRLLQERYRILWDSTIYGRLCNANLLSSDVRERQRQIFKKAFSGLIQDLDDTFDHLFENPSPKHQDLLALTILNVIPPFAADSKNHRHSICPLCRFPSFHLVLAANLLPKSVLSQIKSAHPKWAATEPICQQCLDLYQMQGTGIHNP
ncbi:MAG: hypothetical protein ACE5HS_05610 [bacterium]